MNFEPVNSNITLCAIGRTFFIVFERKKKVYIFIITYKVIKNLNFILFRCIFCIKRPIVHFQKNKNTLARGSH